MTINKTLMSVAAAGALAAMMTGCGSDSSSGSSGGNNGSTAGGVQSSTKAVDGYVYNAKAEAYYLSEDNTTMKAVTMEAASTTKDVVTGKVTVGSSTYALPADTNDTVKKRIKFFKISSKPSSTSGTLYTPPTYVEASGIDGFDGNDTELKTKTIYAPANAAVTSPLTNLVYQANAATLFGTETGVPTTLVDLNATTLAALENNASVIAKNLGLGDVDLLTADPVALAASNPALRLVTALMIDADVNTATTILKAKKPAANLAETLEIVATALPAGNAKTLATTLAAQAKSGALDNEFILKMNIEKSVESGDIATLEAPEVKGKFPITANAIEINDVNNTELIGTGAKIKKETFSVDINMDALDGNISTSKFKAIVSLTGSKDYMAQDDSNESGSLTVEVPFELNATDGSLDVTVPAGAAVPYEAKASDGSEIVAKTDFNASTLGVDGTNVISASGKVLTINVASILENVGNNSADSNLSDGKDMKLDLKDISDAKVYLVDVDGKVVGTDDSGESFVPLAKGTIVSPTGTIAATEAIKIIDNSVVDLRANRTGKNAKPTITSAAASTTTVQVDQNTTLDLNITGLNANDTWEKNTTLAISLLSKNTDGNATEAFMTLADINNTAVKALDGNDSYDQPALWKYTKNTYTGTTTGRHPTATYAIHAVDEFGAVGADKNITLTLNRLPAINTTKYTAGAATKIDANTTTYPAFFTDIDGDDMNATTVFDIANTDTNATIDTNHDMNVTYTTDGNLTIDTNVTAGTYWVAFKIKDNNGSSAVDINLTKVVK